ncbi:MAG: hypothetical protein COB37_09030 [Kordiimonadales bacterium]|nr:MAG: hypothetical protein COB37_09030 [Kordiimonadales bacterium]
MSKFFLSRYIFVLIGLLCSTFAVPVAGVANAAGDPELLKRLSRPALVAAPAMSSDGHFVSSLHRTEGDKAVVAVWRVDEGFKTPEILPYNRTEVRWMSWVGGGRLLMSLKEKGLVLYDAHLKQLRPFIEGKGPRPGDLPPFLLSSLHEDPSNILMQWEDPSEPGFPAVYKVNALTGTSKKIVSAWRPIVRWLASPEGEVRLGEGFVGRNQKIYGRRTGGGWRPILKRDFFRGPAVQLLAVETGGATALVISGHAGDKRELWRMHTSNGEMLARLARNKLFDIDGAIINPSDDQVVGASFTAASRQIMIWQTKALEDHNAVARHLGVRTVELVVGSRDGRRQLYRHRALHRPSLYYIYEPGSGNVMPLPGAEELNALPQIDGQMVWFKVDGMQRPMHAVLSQPKSGSTGKAVVLVHGGPVRRASNSYKAAVSWLVANGYTVLQPNFRGSSGYGEKWRRAGYGEWGDDMQKDVRAAGQWLLDGGYGEAGHMCVMGGSYGGYAALMSAIRDDDMFACAVSLNGVTSIPLLISYLKTLRFPLLTVPRIKARLSSRSLWRRSPLGRADLVRIPVLMLHSTEDVNVPFQQGALMANTLRKRGKEFEFIILKGAEHVLRRASEKRRYMQSALDFIEKHTGGPAG